MRIDDFHSDHLRPVDISDALVTAGHDGPAWSQSVAGVIRRLDAVD